MGNAFIYIGIGFVVVGIAYKFGLLDWFGNLPGDIKYKGEHTFVFFPVTSMLLLSVLLSLVMWFFNKG